METQTKTFCKPQLLTEKRSLRSPKKRSDSGLCQVALGDWPRKDKAVGHPLLQQPPPHHIHILLPPRRPSLKRKCALPTYIQQQDDLNVLFVGVACSVRCESMLFSLGTHVLFVAHTFYSLELLLF